MYIKCKYKYKKYHSVVEDTVDVSNTIFRYCVKRWDIITYQTQYLDIYILDIISIFMY